MLPLLLMLAAQAQPSPQAGVAMTAERAMRCASALRVRDNAAGTADFPLAVRSIYFVMIAARETGGQESFFNRIKVLGAKVGDYAVTMQASTEIIASCLKDEPRADGATVGALPADAAERDLMCVGTLALLEGLATGYRDKSHDGAPAEHWANVLAPFQARVQKGAEAGGHADALLTSMEQATERATRIGAPETLAKMCEAVSH
jgi:hypothetical protein